MAVRDDGPGIGPGARTEGPGIGLANIRTRLEKLYGPDHELDIENVAAGGVKVSLEIPFRAYSASAAEQAP